jgi:glucans biosynthesis protein
MYKVDGEQAREILYSPDYFEMPADHVARGLPPEPSAFAGFWVRESRLEGDWTKREPWATYVGASYWRAVGELGQVGMSSRGVALGTGDAAPEEFPDFVGHWFETAATEKDPVIVHSLLDGPSISGAYRFALHRGKGVTIEVETHLFLRADVAHLGIAPLTSMFWFAEYDKRYREDWRPEVHDADGLALWTGAGERIWRPLNDPPRIITSSFVDDNPKGFGLSQRDRNFEHYLDGVGYDKRPSVWIEPLGGWGKGSVQLVETPTDDEIYDNINAFWVPETPAKAGSGFTFSYRQHWVDKEPFFPPDLARCVATRIGRGGEAGKPRPKGVEKFVVEFAGGDLAKLGKDEKPEAVITASRGTIGSLVTVERIPSTERWRAIFDLAADGQDPVELRLYLRRAGKPLTETWLYQYLPAPGA